MKNTRSMPLGLTSSAILGCSVARAYFNMLAFAPFSSPEPSVSFSHVVGKTSRGRRPRGQKKRRALGTRMRLRLCRWYEAALKNGINQEASVTRRRFRIDTVS